MLIIQGRGRFCKPAFGINRRKQGKKSNKKFNLGLTLGGQGDTMSIPSQE